MYVVIIYTTVYGPTDQRSNRPADRPTNAATYRAAIKVKNLSRTKKKAIDKSNVILIN